MRYERTNFNLENVRMGIRRHRDQHDWRNEYIQLLIDKKHDAAHELRCLNDPRYEEDCREEAEKVFPLESAPLRSCQDVWDEREELEAV